MQTCYHYYYHNTANKTSSKEASRRLLMTNYDFANKIYFVNIYSPNTDPTLPADGGWMPGDGT
jgi:hypothetical protein